DNNGNLKCMKSNGQGSCDATAARYMTWTSFNMADIVMEGANALEYQYGSEHQRVMQCVPSCHIHPPTVIQTSYFDAFGTIAEYAQYGQVFTWKDYLTVDGKLAAEHQQSGGTDTWAYFVLDHLGSLSVVMDASGQVVPNGRLSYDPWGSRRNLNGAPDPGCTIGLSAPTNRGFTGQEEIDSLCLLNLNARIYDPTLGRFLSADAEVAEPFDLQGLNRYSYTINDPLTYVDPSGNDIETVTVFAPQTQTALFAINPALAVVVDTAAILSDLVGLEGLFGASAAPPPVPTTVSVSPNPTTYQAAVHNPSGIAPSGNTAAGAQSQVEQVVVTGTKLQSEAATTSASAYAGASAASADVIIKGSGAEFGPGARPVSVPSWCAQAQQCVWSPDLGFESHDFSKIAPLVEQVVVTAQRLTFWDQLDTLIAQGLTYYFTDVAPAMAAAGGGIVFGGEIAAGSAVADLLPSAVITDSSGQAGTALSTFRYTQEGETFFHYGYAEQAENFLGGLRPGGFATDLGNLTGEEAQSGLSLPHAEPPNAVYTVRPDAGTLLRVNPVTQPEFGQPGGLTEFQFPFGTGPGTVSEPEPIP
ncbi:MAG TPA: RHS repeat-associated core domain-containing protein, partial [Rhizomicrobium sp.]|nr:RHS repeat-associated core domain-containing protein [Rhizomicrobium sp.]